MYFIHGLFIFFNRGFLSIFFPSLSRLSTTRQGFFHGLFIFSIAVFFQFSSHLFLAYPQHDSSAYYTQPLYLCFGSSFQFLYAVHELLPSHKYVPVRETTPDKTLNFQWHMFQMHVAGQILGKANYLPVPLATSFLRNDDEGQGRRQAALIDPCNNEALPCNVALLNLPGNYARIISL